MPNRPLIDHVNGGRQAWPLTTRRLVTGRPAGLPGPAGALARGPPGSGPPIRAFAGASRAGGTTSGSSAVLAGPKEHRLRIHCRSAAAGVVVVVQGSGPGGGVSSRHQVVTWAGSRAAQRRRISCCGL